MYNILFSTTRQFNIGDEAILKGIINVFNDVLGKEQYNSIIYNRNPDIRPDSLIKPVFVKKKFTKSRMIRGKKILNVIFRLDTYDNSMKNDSDYSIIDLVVIAGTPEWYGLKMTSLYRQVKKHDIPIVFLGIGTGENKVDKHLSKLEKWVLEQARLITVRDEMTKRVLNDYKTYFVACPSILSCDSYIPKIKRNGKIGLIYSSSNISVNNRISKETEVKLFSLYSLLAEKYDVEFVCHYVDELEEIEKDFPGYNYRYSYNCDDYYNFYREYDLVIGCRVHGIGIASAVGTPGIIVSHDLRGDTAKEFGAVTLKLGEMSINEQMEIVEKSLETIETTSQKIDLKKREVYRLYHTFISEIIETLN